MPLYHPSVYDFASPVPSYWEDTAPPFEGDVPLKDGESCDVAIIGGGYTGLSAAYHLTRDADMDVRVLEAGEIAWGASGRNGGFCGLHPSSMGYADHIRTYGLEEAKRYITSQVEAIELVRDLITQNGIEADLQGDGMFEVAHNARRFKDLKEEAELLSGTFDVPTRLLSAETFAEEGYNSTEQFGALWIGAGFGLHPLKFARGLGRLASEAGAHLHAHTRVIDWTKAGSTHVLSTARGTLRAKKIIVATNGFTQEALHPAFAGRLLPIMSNIFTTRPLSEAELSAHQWQTECPCSNTRNLLFYYRVLPDRRILFGARGDLTGHPDASQKMFRWLEKRFGEVFPEWQGIEITHFWRGLVCMASNATPALGALEDDPSVFYGMAYHGDGVAAAPWAGRELAALVMGTKSQKDLPRAVQGPPPHIPFPGLRRWYLRAALAYYRLKDL
ncbi:MAG: hypothetical protein COA62_10955 [Rhodobiaceae bacterium]|nr:MAG: hypothetical protein COA62_10955 [Rhodobiaceae bacterium]